MLKGGWRSVLEVQGGVLRAPAQGARQQLDRVPRLEGEPYAVSLQCSVVGSTLARGPCCRNAGSLGQRWGKAGEHRGQPPE